MASVLMEFVHAMRDTKEMRVKSKSVQITVRTIQTKALVIWNNINVTVLTDLEVISAVYERHH